MTLTNSVIKVKKAPRAIGYRGFAEAWVSLARKDMIPLRRELMDQLGWSLRTFEYRKNGLIQLRENEVSVVESVFAAYGIDSWSGNRINNQ